MMKSMVFGVAFLQDMLTESSSNIFIATFSVYLVWFMSYDLLFHLLFLAIIG